MLEDIEFMKKLHTQLTNEVWEKHSSALSGVTPLCTHRYDCSAQSGVTLPCTPRYDTALHTEVRHHSELSGVDGSQAYRFFRI